MLTRKKVWLIERTEVKTGTHGFSPYHVSYLLTEDCVLYFAGLSEETEWFETKSLAVQYMKRKSYKFKAKFNGRQYKYKIVKAGRLFIPQKIHYRIEK